jgi:hypothetical protein
LSSTVDLGNLISLPEHPNGGDTNDTKIETTGEIVETVAEDPNALEDRMNTGYNC